MGSEDTLEFEKLKDVQVNLLGYENDKLFPLKFSSHEYKIAMGLFLLYDENHHHNLPIIDQVKIVC